VENLDSLSSKNKHCGGLANLDAPEVITFCDNILDHSTSINRSKCQSIGTKRNRYQTLLPMKQNRQREVHIWVWLAIQSWKDRDYTNATKENVACLHKTIQQMSSTLYIWVRVSWQLAECIKDFIEKCDEIISCYLHMGATAVTLMLFQMYLFFYTTFCTLEPSSSFWPHVHLSQTGASFEKV
jgi:hypothetical protein